MIKQHKINELTHEQTNKQTRVKVVGKKVMMLTEQKSNSEKQDKCYSDFSKNTISPLSESNQALSIQTQTEKCLLSEFLYIFYFQIIDYLKEREAVKGKSNMPPFKAGNSPHSTRPTLVLL